MEKQLQQETESFAITANLTAQIISAEEGGYVVDCPSLDIVSQGETIAEARANIKEAAELMIEVCFERGTLHHRLKKSGFRFAGKKLPRKKRRKPLGTVVREIRFRVKVKLSAS